MASVIWRILFGILAFLFVWAILPPILRVLGLQPDADVLQIIRLCIAALVVLYILVGPRLPAWLVGPPA